MNTIPWLEEEESLGQLRLVLPQGAEKDRRILLDEVRRSVGGRSMAGLSFGRSLSDFDVDIVVASGDVMRETGPFVGVGSHLSELVPGQEKSEWVLRRLGIEDKVSMAEDLFRIALEVCRTRDLRPLENAVLSWEATAEEVADTRSAGVRDEGDDDAPVSLDELRRRLSE